MALQLAFVLSVLTAMGHSLLSERLYLRPMRLKASEQGVFANRGAQKLVTAMFHLPSLAWVALGVSLLLLQPGQVGYEETMAVYALLFGLSGAGNFWATGKAHFGGIMLFATSGLILLSTLS